MEQRGAYLTTETTRPAATGARDVVFRVGWAVAALFHLAGNARPSFAPATALLTVSWVALGVTALLICLRPRAQWPSWVLCALIPLTAWLEAPIVGNHWVLASALSLTYLLASAVAALTGASADRRTVWVLFAPTGRLVLLVAYAFAAFAKLNSGFFDPATSCAVYYHNQLVSSWGMSALSVEGHPWLGRMTAAGAAAVELSVPLLLVFLHRWGVLLALSFHWFLAMDLAQHFWDFSSMLFVAFLLFLDDGQVHRLARTLGNVRDSLRPSLRLVLASLGAVLALLPVMASGLPGSGVLRALAVGAGHLGWWVVGTGVLFLVLVATLRPGEDSERPSVRPAAAVLWLVPALVAFNGFTPYLELKTGFGWNMYSNLRTVAGETNHFIIPRTLDLTGLQTDQVEILDSSDPTLVKLAEADYRVTYSEFREYAHDYPDASVVYRRGGRVYSVERVGDSPAGRGEVSAISRRLQSFRVIDASGRERCQPVFSAAR